MLRRNNFPTLATTALALPLVLAACASSESSRETAIMNGMLGEEVNSLCFTRDIRSWHEFDRQSIILEARRDDYYKVDLAGVCDARNAFMQVEVVSRTGVCLGPGDQIRFDHDIGGASCTIRDIHRWHPAEMTDQD